MKTFGIDNLNLEPKGNVKLAKEFIENNIPIGQYMFNRDLVAELKIPLNTWEKISLHPTLSEFRIRHPQTKQVIWGNVEDIKKLSERLGAA